MQRGQDPNDRASGRICAMHFRSRTATIAQVWACAACQQAKREESARIQREETIDPSQPFGTKILLACRNHPELDWATKNIGHIGARSIFYLTPDQAECACPVSDLVVAERCHG